MLAIQRPTIVPDRFFAVHGYAASAGFLHALPGPWGSAVHAKLHVRLRRTFALTARSATQIGCRNILRLWVE
jgi:hypothetical protein